MSTIKSSDEHLILNADGSNKSVKFQANGVEKASISSAGAFTSTTIDATKLTGDLPAISGANLTGVGVAGISSSADATAITIGLDERVAIKATTPKADLHLKAHNNGWTGGMLVEHNSGDKGWHIHPENNSENGLWFGYRADTTSAIGSESVATHLQLTSDGRGKSQFTAKAWVVWTGGGTSINDSHNVSSITYLSTGVYEINYSNSLAGTDRYAINVTPSDKSGYWNNSIASIVDGESNASKTRILTMRSTTGGTENVDNIYAIVFGDN